MPCRFLTCSDAGCRRPHCATAFWWKIRKSFTDSIRAIGPGRLETETVMAAIISRRSTMGGLSAAAIAGSASAAEKVNFKVPDGACDCHHHIYDTRFEYIPNAKLKPPPAPVSEYR